MAPTLLRGLGLAGAVVAGGPCLREPALPFEHPARAPDHLGRGDQRARSRTGTSTASCPCRSSGWPGATRPSCGSRWLAACIHLVAALVFSLAYVVLRALVGEVDSWIVRRVRHLRGDLRSASRADVPLQPPHLRGHHLREPRARLLPQVPRADRADARAREAPDRGAPAGAAPPAQAPFPLQHPERDRLAHAHGRRGRRPDARPPERAPADHDVPHRRAADDAPGGGRLPRAVPRHRADPLPQPPRGRRSTSTRTRSTPRCRA